LTLSLRLLKMINDGCTAMEIAKVLGISKSLLSYHIKKAIDSGYVAEVGRDAFKIYELTQPGKNLLAMYQQQQQTSMSICRAENVRFKAPVYKMPSIQVDWHKVEMHNWNQYNIVVGSVKVKLNAGDIPTIEFLPAAIDGNDPNKLYIELSSDCTEVAKRLEQIFDMQIGRLELSSKGEWVVYNPLAKAITNTTGRL
jgi:predicted transcriptional regulator